MINAVVVCSLRLLKFVALMMHNPRKLTVYALVAVEMPEALIVLIVSSCIICC